MNVSAALIFYDRDAWLRIYCYKKDIFMNFYDGQGSYFGAYQPYPFYPYLPWADEKTRDKRRFQELYPSLARQIQPLVEEACDRMEYEGSLMFDVYPDKLLIRRMVRSIYEKLDKGAYQDELAAQENTGKNWTEEYVAVLLLNEMYQRRCRRRERRYGSLF